jgi:lysophospholipase
MATMLSDVAELSNFKNHEMPFPIWQAPQGNTPHELEFFGFKIASYNSTMYEWSPLEFGAWQGPGFFPTKYLGTKMSDGKPVDQCLVGFDRAGFMLGMAADAANLCKSNYDGA